MGWDSFYNNSVFFASLYRMLKRHSDADNDYDNDDDGNDAADDNVANTWRAKTYPSSA